MQIVDKFIGYVKSEAIHHPEKSWNKILLDSRPINGG